MRNPRVFESRIFDLILETIVIDMLNHVHIRYVCVDSRVLFDPFLKLIHLILFVNIGLMIFP